ncbi:hypothetical protein BT67DRAFT_39783 [Trichocladium antarcticum]|uniref:Uncharacterized protein n=1 Tax=Trichocladium antarcticum TaxID=1450529 RepID=A0AAN6ZC68_9PEZI|nr:hypothetical protein BT67DRAFT_39783 [Trichocladium antarcticum]
MAGSGKIWTRRWPRFARLPEKYCGGGRTVGSSNRHWQKPKVVGNGNLGGWRRFIRAKVRRVCAQPRAGDNQVGERDRGAHGHKREKMALIPVSEILEGLMGGGVGVADLQPLLVVLLVTAFAACEQGQEVTTSLPSLRKSFPHCDRTGRFPANEFRLLLNARSVQTTECTVPLESTLREAELQVQQSGAK